MTRILAFKCYRLDANIYITFQVLLKTVTMFSEILVYTLKSDTEVLNTKRNLAISKGAVPILTSYNNMWYR